MRLLFNGDIFSNYKSADFKRSGIYFVAYALLKEFCKTEDLSVTVYCSHEKKQALKDFKEYSRLDFDIKTFRSLPHRLIKTRLIKCNEKREGKGLEPLRGTWRLYNCFEFLDRIFANADAKEFRRYDLCFSPCDSTPYAIERSGIPIYTVIHDLIPIITGEFPIGKGYWLYDVLRSVSPEKYYFCISECTRNDFLKHCPEADPEHVKVVYNGYVPREAGLKKAEAEAVIGTNGLKWKRYILILGTVVPHKNVERQIRAGIRFIKEKGLSDFKIAIVGSCNNTEEFLDKADISTDDRKFVAFCGYVSDEHIQAYYKGAFCLSFTSLYEGFGLPTLEAMMEGCPVVTSNTSSLPEVVGDAAICIPPEDEDAHVEAYSRLLADTDLVKELTKRGKDRVKMFTWNKAAKQMMDVMRNMTE